MANSRFFDLTLQSLSDEERTTRTVMLSGAIVLVLLWAGWMLFARVSIYAGTERARIEVTQAVYPVQAQVSGRVLETGLALGRTVGPGAVLVRLEADPEQLKVEEQRTRGVSFGSQLENLRRELAADKRSLDNDRGARLQAVEQSQAEVAQARAALAIAEELTRRNGVLWSAGLIPELDFLRGQAEADKASAQLRAAQAAAARAEREKLLVESDREARIEAIKRSIEQIGGESTASGATVERLEHELRRYTIVAPGAGRLGEVTNLRVGAYVNAGDRLAAIVPDGNLHIVAEFDPRDAVGRIRSGQGARLRLNAFPWAQYGSVRARVTKVGDEVRDGRVRVELDPLDRNARIPMQHGLTGTLEVEVDRVTPFQLVMREAGQFVGQPAPQAGSR